MQECILRASGGSPASCQQLVDAAIFAIDHDIERIEPALLTVRARVRRNSPPPSKTRVMTYRRLKVRRLAAPAPAAGGLSILNARRSYDARSLYRELAL